MGHREIIGFALVFLGLWGGRGALAASATGALFLARPNDARTTALGSALAGSLDGSAALFGNPAGLGRAGRGEVSLSHVRWATEEQQNTVSYARGSRKIAWGVTWLRIDHPSLEQRAADRTRLGTLSIHDEAVGLGFSTSLGPLTHVGVNAMWLRQTIGGARAQGLAFDFGFVVSPSSRAWSLGAVARHVGSPLSYDGDKLRLPTVYAVGAVLPLGARTRGRVDTEWDDADQKWLTRVGGECALTDTFFLRAGYAPSRRSTPSAGEGLVWGLGVVRGGWVFDYAMLPASDNKESLQFTLRWRF